MTINSTTRRNIFGVKIYRVEFEDDNGNRQHCEAYTLKGAVKRLELVLKCALLFQEVNRGSTEA